GLFLLVLALLRGNEQGWGSAPIVAELAGAGLLLAAFLAIETRVKEPMLPLRLFRNKEFAGAQVAVYLPCTVLIFVVSGGSASLLEKVSAGAMIAVGLAFVTIGLALGLLATATSSWVMLIPSLLVGGLGTGLYNPAGAAVALASAPPEQSGLAAGVNDTFRQAGIAVGVALFGALIPGA